MGRCNVVITLSMSKCHCSHCNSHYMTRSKPLSQAVGSQRPPQVQSPIHGQGMCTGQSDQSQNSEFLCHTLMLLCWISPTKSRTTLNCGPKPMPTAWILPKCKTCEVQSSTNTFCQTKMLFLLINVTAPNCSSKIDSSWTRLSADAPNKNPNVGPPGKTNRVQTALQQKRWAVEFWKKCLPRA